VEKVMVNFRAPFAGCLLSLAASAAVAAPFAQLSSADQQLAAANHPAAVTMIASKPAGEPVVPSIIFTAYKLN